MFIAYPLSISLSYFIELHLFLLILCYLLSKIKTANMCTLLSSPRHVSKLCINKRPFQYVDCFFHWSLYCKSLVVIRYWRTSRPRSRKLVHDFWNVKTSLCRWMEIIQSHVCFWTSLPSCNLSCMKVVFTIKTTVDVNIVTSSKEVRVHKSVELVCKLILHTSKSNFETANIQSLMFIVVTMETLNFKFTSWQNMQAFHGYRTQNS